MKNKRNCLFMLIVLIPVLFANPIKVNAVNTGFDTNDLPDERKDSNLSYIDLSLTNNEPAKKPIDCFAVNEDGLIAIGFSRFEKRIVCVYTSDGVFQYGYIFKDMGAFGLEWDNENLNIYLVRGGIIISVTPSGEVVDVLEIQDTQSNNEYSNELLYSTKRTIGNTEYSIESDIGAFLDFFAPSYSQIVITNENGERSIIYDVNDEQLFNMVLIITGFTAMFCLCAVLGYKEFRKHKYGG